MHIHMCIHMCIYIYVCVCIYLKNMKSERKKLPEILYLIFSFANFYPFSNNMDYLYNFLSKNKNLKNWNDFCFALFEFSFHFKFT